MTELRSNSETEPENAQESDHSSDVQRAKKQRGRTSSASPQQSISEDSAVDPGKCSTVRQSSAEALYSAEMLIDLAGSTSAKVRRMSDNERALVHYKRRLRNRESAKRSRARRQATLKEIQKELTDLRDVTASLLDRCMRLAHESDRQQTDITILRKERALLESLLRGNSESFDR